MTIANIRNFFAKKLNTQPDYNENSWVRYETKDDRCTMHFQIEDLVTVENGNHESDLVFDMGCYKSNQRARKTCLRQALRFLTILKDYLNTTAAYFHKNKADILQSFTDEREYRHSHGHTATACSLNVLGPADNTTKVRFFPDHTAFSQKVNMCKDGRELYVTMKTSETTANGIYTRLTRDLDEQIQHMDKYIAYVKECIVKCG